MSYTEYRDALLNKKCLRHSINKDQSKDHEIGTCESNKTTLIFFDDKVNIRNNGFNYKKQLS